MTGYEIGKGNRDRRICGEVTEYDQKKIVWESRRTNTYKQNTFYTYVKQRK